MSSSFTYRPTLFHLRGTGAKFVQNLLQGNTVGNYDVMVADALDHDIWDVVEVDYTGATINMLNEFTLADGVGKLTSLINRLPAGAKFALCGMSQGAMVCSEVYKDLVSGELMDRRDDFVAGVMFGNPYREDGHTIPGGTDPGGKGIADEARLLTDSEPLWWDFCDPLDWFSNNPNDAFGDDATAVFEFVMLNFTGHGSLYQLLLDSFAWSDPARIEHILVLSQLLTRELPDAITLVNIFNEDANRFGHLRYHFPYTGLPGNTTRSAVDLGVEYLNSVGGSLPPTPPPSATSGPHSGNEDRFHFIVEEAVTGEILSRDLVVQKPKLLRVVSGAANIQFDINVKDASAAGIYFKPWGQLIHAEKTVLGDRKIWTSAIVVPSQIDKKTGIIHLEAQGFSGYTKKMPMLFNWNPLACDAFEPVHKIWSDLQLRPQGNLGVEVYPALSGIEMLPGYAFDGELANLNFFAQFVRAEDRADSADWIDKLARDIPFDYVEQSGWNVDRTAIWKKLFLGYPKAGVQQDNLAFVLGENVIEAAPHIETEIDWCSDVVVTGWFPGQEHSVQLTNSDPLRFRRVIMDDDARINSDERAAAWARRKLSRRQTPAYWESIIIDPGHSNAPFGSFDVGDRIWVSGKMPIVGDIRQLHKIIAIAYEEETQTLQLSLKAEGAFNYDPIYFQQGANGKTIVVPQSITITTNMDVPAIG